MHLKQRYPHLQVVLSVGGSASAEMFPVVASSAGYRDTFARSARGLVEASGMDGIDGESFSFSLATRLSCRSPSPVFRPDWPMMEETPYNIFVPTNQDVIRRCDIGPQLTAND